MSLDKTLTDIGRRKLDFDKYNVFEALPGHFDEKYPKLVNFLQEYYKTLEEGNNASEALNDLLLNRDITGAKVELLDFIANELLLGASYYESFEDKRTSLQYSNLLYRSKGTEFSIKQFFRVFFGIDVDVRYGKDEVFYVGDPAEEEMIFSDASKFGNNFPYTFRGGTITVSMENSDGGFTELRQDVDYIQNFHQRLIELRPVDSAGLTLTNFDPATETATEGDSDSKLSFLSKNGKVPSDTKLKLFTTTRTQTTIGTEITDKRLTNNKFYQLYGLLIETPIDVNVWKQAYKSFVHPAGMFLQGNVAITSIFDINIGPQPSFIEPPPPVDVFSNAQIIKGTGKGNTGGDANLFTSISEIADGPFGERIRTRVNDLKHPTNIAGWHTQYRNIAQADLIEGRRLDDTYADLSNTINTLDEGRWYGYDSAVGQSNIYTPDSDGAGTDIPVLGANTNIHLTQFDSYPLLGD